MVAMDERKWDVLVAARLYGILAFIVMPVVHVSIELGYAQPVGIIILGFAAWLVFKFVLLETRTGSRRFLIGSLAFLVPASALIFINFLIGLIINAAHDNSGGLVLDLCVVVGACVYFPAMILLRPLKGLNSRAATVKAGGASFLRRNFLEVVLACWVLVSFLILALPYRVYVQAPPKKSGALKPTRLGFWTGDRFFNKDTAPPGRYVTDRVLSKFGASGVYVVYSGMRTDEIGDYMVRDFTRCRDHGVEVNVSVSSMGKGDSFVNVWSFENLSGQVDQALSFLDDNGLLGDPITTLAYDMEPPRGRFFPRYGKDPEIIAKLPDYYRVEGLFHHFNRHVRDDYGLRVRICAETFQALDPRDGDDDLVALYGTLTDDDARRSYMIYRRAAYAANYPLDSARYLRPGDTIVLNSWKFEGYQCWADLDCAIGEARLVAGYPGRDYNLEVYALCYFLDSFGEAGLFDFIDAVTGDKSSWPEVEVVNRWPYSLLWDLALIGISTLDLYGPVFRAWFHAY